MKFSMLRHWAARRGSPSTAALRRGEATHAEHAWDKSRAAGSRWAAAGACLGALLACVIYAPANLLAQAVASASDRHVLLADARGSIWSGSAVAVLTGGAGSRTAAALPGRLEWSVGLSGATLELRARHACCLNGTMALRVSPGFLGRAVTLMPATASIGQWPSAWLAGLGTPWNTLQLSGTLRAASPGFTLEWVEGRWRATGQVEVELLNASSRVSTLDVLGSYHLRMVGDGGQSRLELSTRAGSALQLSGTGTWGPDGVRFRGEARAGEADEAALGNLLNIIGQRQGARSVISIG